MGHAAPMKFSFWDKASVIAFTAATAFVLCFFGSGCTRTESATLPLPVSVPPSNSAPTIQLSGDQLNSIKIGPVGTYSFSVEKTGIGNIDFQNNLFSDSVLSTPVYSPEPGTLSKMFVELGDQVQKGQALYLIETGTTHLPVASPISGQIAAINVSPGTSVQPGRDPAPCSVADVSTKWLLANVPEIDIPFYHPGGAVKATVPAYPNRIFKGEVLKMYPDVDPNTRRATVRCEISDTNNLLRAGMLANFITQAQKPVESIAIPANGVVRESDGTMTAWVTSDRNHFEQRVVKIGLQNGKMDQILSGLQRGELVVTDGAIFLDNMLQAPPGDD